MLGYKSSITYLNVGIDRLEILIRMDSAQVI